LINRLMKRGLKRISSKVIGYLDSPTDNQVATGAVQVAGWIVDPTGPGAVIELRLDDHPLLNNVQITSRPDVDAAFPSNSSRREATAFIARVDTSHFPDGFHQITCVVRKSGNETAVASRTFRTRNCPRSTLSSRYLQGSGIEIGALHNPMGLPDGCDVAYVDRLNVCDLRQQYPELVGKPLVDVDVIDDGEKLVTFGASSQDFIIANHFLEHTQDPIGTIKRHLEVLKPGGILCMAVPDKRETFDRRRSVTSLENLYRDYHDGPNWSYMDHVHEWCSLVGDLKEEAFHAAVQHVVDTQYSIHFHVWTQNELLEFLVDIRRRVSLPFDILAISLKGYESIVVLKKWQST
jgi:predicted SAM-dependent methyltransferase